MIQAVVTPSGLAEQAHELESALNEAFERVARSGWYVLGPEVEAFEQEFATWIGTEHGVGVNSGTDALTLALRACDVGPGDEVILPSNALPTAYGVAATGATLRFADVQLDDYNLDPADVRALISPRTKAIVAVHLYGHPADLPALQSIADEHAVALIEDCAQAHGAAIGDGRVGSFGTAAAFSFYPTKNLGALGDGGMVLTRDGELAARVRRLRMYGERSRYRSVELGVNSRLDELQAAILRAKLGHLDQFLERRREVARAYDEALAGVVSVPPSRPGVVHGRHLYPIRVEDRDEMLQSLSGSGIPCAVHYPVGAHDQPCFSEMRDRGLPVTERLSAELLSLPMHPQMTDEAIAAVIAATREAT